MGVTVEERDAFLDLFFGSGNAYPRTAPAVQPFLDAMVAESEAPFILPRVGPGPNDLLIYVIPRAGGQAMAVREWVAAFVVPSYAPYSTRSLDPDDSVDAAVIDFVGHRSIVLLDVQTATSKELWAALQRLVDGVARKPESSATAPVPLSRLLSDFELALAAGDSATSEEILKRLSGNGLSGVNHTYLVLKRFARLGNYGDLLRWPNLKSVAASQPPVPVRDAILSAIYRYVVKEKLESGDLDAAKQALVDEGAFVPPLATGSFDGLSEEALRVLAVAAAALNDQGLRAELGTFPKVNDLLTDLGMGSPQVPTADKVAGSGEEESPTVGQSAIAEGSDMESHSRPEPQAEARPEPGSAPEPESEPEPEVTQPESWPELVTAVARGASISDVLSDEPWRGWPNPVEEDDAIADVFGELNEIGARRAWGLAGPFVDSDEYGSPAAKTAQAFIDIGLLLARFGPADLAGLVALTDIVLRSAPSSRQYRRLLDDLNADVVRWVSVERASVALDLADLTACNAAPDGEARLRLVTDLLEPLSRQRGRLSAAEIELARLIDSELGLGLPWDQDEVSEVGAGTSLEGNLLLYSLDPNSLARVETALAELAPGVTVRSSTDRVGSGRLRDWARAADYIALATRCAKHAATGFIRQNSSERAVIVEANGAGSASLLQAAMDALRSGAAAPSWSG